jgi:hypothetical protein
MSISNRGTAAACLLMAVVLAGCTATEAAVNDVPAAVVEDIKNSDVKKVTFSKEAAEALGVKTAAVTRSANGQLTMPYDAVIYYLDGTTWAYAATGERAYSRVPVTVTSISGGNATLSAGPTAGTQVVVVGAPEVLGAELEIDGEQ